MRYHNLSLSLDLYECRFYGADRANWSESYGKEFDASRGRKHSTLSFLLYLCLNPLFVCQAIQPYLPVWEKRPSQWNAALKKVTESWIGKQLPAKPFFGKLIWQCERSLLCTDLKPTSVTNNSGGLLKNSGLWFSWRHISLKMVPLEVYNHSFQSA